MDKWTIKTLNPICRLFFKIDLLTDSRWVFFDPTCELLPPWMKELYLCTVAPLPSLWPPPLLPLSKLNVQYIQTMCGCEGSGWGVELCCRPYSAGVLHSVSDQIQNLQNCFTTSNKMSSKDDIKGLVSLKFLHPWSMVLNNSPSQANKLFPLT